MRLALALGDENAVSMPVAAAANEVNRPLPLFFYGSPFSIRIYTKNHIVSFVWLLTHLTHFELPFILVFLPVSLEIKHYPNWPFLSYWIEIATFGVILLVTIPESVLMGFVKLFIDPFCHHFFCVFHKLCFLFIYEKMQAFKKARSTGLGDLDFSAVYEIFKITKPSTWWLTINTLKEVVHFRMIQIKA